MTENNPILSRDRFIAGRQALFGIGCSLQAERAKINFPLDEDAELWLKHNAPLTMLVLANSEIRAARIQ